MLDSELSSIHRILLHKNFVRVMHRQVGHLLQLLHDCVNENEGLEPTFYQRLSDAWSILMDYFHAGGKGIAMETFETIPAHKVCYDHYCQIFIKIIFRNWYKNYHLIK